MYNIKFRIIFKFLIKLSSFSFLEILKNFNKFFKIRSVDKLILQKQNSIQSCRIVNCVTSTSANWFFFFFLSSRDFIGIRRESCWSGWIVHCYTGFPSENEKLNPVEFEVKFVEFVKLFPSKEEKFDWILYLKSSPIELVNYTIK